MARGVPIDLAAAFAALTPLADRTPATSAAESAAAFAMLAPFGEGGAFIAAFAGRSPWERHEAGDELVHAVEGETDIILYRDGQEIRRRLGQGMVIVVPQGTWHRFETRGVKLLTLTPLPTEHHAGDIPPGEP